MMTSTVVNPARIKAYADSRMGRQKTDKTDALVIALFCQTQQPTLWTLPPAERQELKMMVRHLQVFKTMRQQELNRRGSEVGAPIVCQALDQHIVFLTQQIAALEQAIRDHIDRHPTLKQQRDLLDSIPDLGDTTIAVLLADIRDITAFDSAAQLTAYAGCRPTPLSLGIFGTWTNPDFQTGRCSAAGRTLLSSDGHLMTQSGDPRFWCVPARQRTSGQSSHCGSYA